MSHQLQISLDGVAQWHIKAPACPWSLARCGQSLRFQFVSDIITLSTFLSTVGSAGQCFVFVTLGWEQWFTCHRVWRLHHCLQARYIATSTLLQSSCRDKFLFIFELFNNSLNIKTLRNIRNLIWRVIFVKLMLVNV